MLKKFINNLIGTLQSIEGREIDLSKADTIISSQANSEGKIIIVSVGPLGSMISEFIKSFDYLFKLPKDKIKLISIEKSYGDITDWKHFENNKTIGALAAIETNITSDDLVIGLSVTGNTNFTNFFLKEAKNSGAKTMFLTSSKHKFDIADLNLHLDLEKKTIDGLYIGNHTTILKVVIESLLFDLMREMGQIIDGKIMTTRVWTQKLFDVSMEVVRSFKSEITDNEFRELLDQTNGELSLVIIMLVKNVSADEALALAEKHNYNFKKILK